MSLSAALSTLGVGTLRDIAADVLRCSIDWRNDARGYCPCPGAGFHSTRTARRDCMVAVDAVPSLTCVHSSCSAEVAAATVRLRSAIGRALWELERGQNPSLPERRAPTAEERARHQRRASLARLGAKAATARARILAENPWTVGELTAASPVTNAGETPWRILDLFAPDVAVWIGGKFDSGHERHARFFRDTVAWAGKLRWSPQDHGPHLSCSAWRPGSFRRTRENLARQPFLLVECDGLAEHEQCALARWLTTGPRLRLRAAIHSGKRSIHFWFDRPAAPARMEEFAVLLPALGCDPKPLTNPAGISRLPGIVREDTGREQRLLFLDPFDLTVVLQPAILPPVAG